MPLPNDELFCPKLTCTVYDQIFKGWNQPIIGVFTLHIGDLMAKLKEERKSETAAMEKAVKELKAIVANPNFRPPSYGGTGVSKAELIDQK